jgi:hypothetical protein
VEFTGDPEGIAAFKALYARDKPYVKFLLGEARSNTDFTARFTDEAGRKWAVVFEPRTGNVLLKPEPPPAA